MTIDAVDQGGLCCVSEQVSWASREMQPEIEIECKRRRTDVPHWNVGKETADERSRWEVPGQVCQG